MSDPTPSASAAGHAWSTTSRQAPDKRPATERVADFLEVYGTLGDATAREQAARCIQCPDPLCVTGCPLHLNVPEWLALVADGQFPEAATVLHATGSMPEVCLRLCPADHLCEGMCVIGGRADPVAIWALEHFINDHAFNDGVVTATIAPANGQRVAVAGATAGGLACAAELAKNGYSVTVFDSAAPEDRLGEATPAFRLPPAIAARRVTIIKQQGVAFRPVAAPDPSVTLAELTGSFAAVYLAWDAKRPRTLEIPGIDLSGVAQARTFVLHHRASAASPLPGLDVRGKRVLVIGGGDTAIDCLRSALRCGARQALGVYRGGEEAMSCARREYENAIEEGVVYAFAATPVAILGDANGTGTAVRFARTPFGTQTANAPRLTPLLTDTDFEVETDLVFVAIGYEPDRSGDLFNIDSLAVSPTGALVTNSQQMTSRPGVFAGGELTRGPCMPLEAVNDARNAARAIDLYIASQAGAVSSAST